MLIAPHWALRSYLKEFREGSDNPNSKHDARLYVLITLILHANNRLRCWPSTDTLCEETGYNSPSVVEARDWLLERKAIILVPYDKREGLEKELPPRQFVYQLTGAMVTKQGIRPYLAMSDEAADQLKSELEALDFKVSETETSQTKTFVSTPKGITSSKGSTKKKDTSATPNGAQSETLAGFTVGQKVIYVHEASGGYGYIYYIPSTVVKVTEKRVILDCPSKKGGTVRRTVKPDKLFATEEEARAKMANLDTLEDLQPLQQVIGANSYKLQAGQGITARTNTLINMIYSEVQGRYQNGSSVTPEELAAAYGWYRANSNSSVPTDGAKVAKMVQDYRDTQPRSAVKVAVHIPHGVIGCPNCFGNGFTADTKTGASIPCPTCLAAEKEGERREPAA